MTAHDDLIGCRLGRLLVLERGEPHRFPTGSAQSRWKCLCECGNEALVLRQSLTRGRTASCGCYRRLVAPIRDPHDRPTLF